MPRPETEPERPALAGRLRDLIAASGLTQSQVAEAAGMSQSQLSQILTGHRADPAASTVGRILAALGLPWSALD